MILCVCAYLQALEKFQVNDDFAIMSVMSIISFPKHLAPMFQAFPSNLRCVFVRARADLAGASECDHMLRGISHRGIVVTEELS